MARPPRELHEGIYHVTAHGSDARYLFLDDEDRKDFLARLAAVCEGFELALLSWVLLGSHYHALLRIPDARLSCALQRLHTGYSRRLNKRSNRTAHLFRENALDWPWSSARAHAGFERPRIPIAESDLRAAFGSGKDWRREYLRTLAAA